MVRMWNLAWLLLASLPINLNAAAFEGENISPDANVVLQQTDVDTSAVGAEGEADPNTNVSPPAEISYESEQNFETNSNTESSNTTSTTSISLIEPETVTCDPNVIGPLLVDDPCAVKYVVTATDTTIITDTDTNEKVTSSTETGTSLTDPFSTCMIEDEPQDLDGMEKDYSASENDDDVVVVDYEPDLGTESNESGEENGLGESV